MYSANARTSTHARSYVLAMTHICAVPMTMDVYVLHATTSSMLSTWRQTSCNHHGIFLQTRPSLYIARMWYLQYVGNLRAFFPIYICTIAACSNGANKIRLYMLDSKNSRKNFSFCRLIFCPSKARHLRLLSLTQLLSGLSGLVNITSRKNKTRTYIGDTNLSCARAIGPHMMRGKRACMREYGIHLHPASHPNIPDICPMYFP